MATWLTLLVHLKGEGGQEEKGRDCGCRRWWPGVFVSWRSIQHDFGESSRAQRGMSGDDQGPLLSRGCYGALSPNKTQHIFVSTPHGHGGTLSHLRPRVCPRSSPLCQMPSICPPGPVCTLLLPAPAQEADPSIRACLPVGRGWTEGRARRLGIYSTRYLSGRRPWVRSVPLPLQGASAHSLFLPGFQQPPLPSSLQTCNSSADVNPE